MSIQQAIFTSIRGDQRNGYQVASAGEGLSQSQLDQLATWAPAHDSLLPSAARGSVNFCALDESTWLLSRTQAAGEEYSGRGGPRVYTHCLFVPTETMARFAWQPFRLLDAVLATGRLRVRMSLPPSLPAFRVTGGAVPARDDLLAKLAASPTQGQALALLDALIVGHQQAIFVAGSGFFRRLDEALSLLPVPCRAEVSFTTGLRESRQRPLKVLPAPPDTHQQQLVSRRKSAVVLDLENPPPPQSGWRELVEGLLTAGRTGELAALLAEDQGDLKLADLGELATC